jgi:membrane protein required for colicin V production
MTGFDLLLAAIILASTLLALNHGIIRELIAVAAWILGVGFALLFSGAVGRWFPANLLGDPHWRYVIAFVIILVITLIIGAVLSSLLKSGAKAIGLGALDRILGGLFGVARGILVAMVLVLILVSTAYAHEPWWQKSRLVPMLLVGSMMVRAQLPPDWAAYLNGTLPPPPLAPPASKGQQKV